MKKIVYLLFFAILFTSCGADSSKIIGKKFSPMSVPYGEFMRRTIIFIFISLLFFSCEFDPQRINPNKIIGKDGSKKPYGSGGLYCTKYIDGNSYSVHGTLYRNKVIAYVTDKEGIIIDYFFSNLVEYDKVKEIPLGISYNELVNILGEPVGLLCVSEYIEEIEKGSINDTFGKELHQME
jgi:hypothetical protein